MNWVQGLLLGAVWCVLTRVEGVVDVAAGLSIGLVVAWLLGSRPRPLGEHAATPLTLARLPRRVVAIASLAAFFLWELILSNLRVALLVLRPRGEIQTAILDVPVSVGSERELALLADLVTLTPGTLTIDAAPDGSSLRIHVLSSTDPEQVRVDIQEGLVPRVRRVFR